MDAWVLFFRAKFLDVLWDPKFISPFLSPSFPVSSPTQPFRPVISLQDENRDKTIEEELGGGNQQILMKPLSHLPLAGSAGHDAVTEGRVCTDILLTVDLIESQAVPSGSPAPL